MTCATPNMQSLLQQIPAGISSIKRILLLTDGTVTDILRAHLQEPIDVIRLKQAPSRSPEVNQALGITSGTPVVFRHSLIQGKQSSTPLIMASSILVPERLPEDLKQKIAQPEMAIGWAIQSARVETYREILDIGELDESVTVEDYDGDPLTLHFSLQRRYRIMIEGQPCIHIQERFTDSF
ncbi:MAG: DUF98 domain-containing protein [Gammaproteobacteria bacterium]|nr:MAG: DUF98 domain-containing protein [Gammaproteobacteria bacterium]